MDLTAAFKLQGLGLPQVLISEINKYITYKDISIELLFHKPINMKIENDELCDDLRRHICTNPLGGKNYTDVDEFYIFRINIIDIISFNLYVKLENDTIYYSKYNMIGLGVTSIYIYMDVTPRSKYLFINWEKTEKEIYKFISNHKNCVSIT